MLFRFVERAVGAAREGLDLRGGADGDPDGYCHPARRLGFATQIGVVYGATNPFGHLGGFNPIRSRQHDRELLAAVAIDHVAGPHVGRQ